MARWNEQTEHDVALGMLGGAKRVCVTRLPSTYVVFDLETTGLDTERDRIVEIGALKVVDDEVVDSYTSLVNPGKRIDPKASAVNGITNAMVKDAPTERQAVAAFLKFADGMVLLGHNVEQFDSRFIERVTGEPPAQGYYDTLSLARTTLVGKKSMKALCERYGIANAQAHRALSDCQANHEVYQAIKRDLMQVTQDARDLDSLVADEGPLVGETLCFAGSASGISTHDLMVLAAENGARLANNVTLKVTKLVVCDPDMGETRKVKKAREYAGRTGVEVVDCEWLLRATGQDLSRARRELVGILNEASRPEATPREQAPVSAPATQRQGMNKETRATIAFIVVCLILIAVILFVFA